MTANGVVSECDSRCVFSFYGNDECMCMIGGTGREGDDGVERTYEARLVIWMYMFAVGVGVALTRDPTTAKKAATAIVTSESVF